jgi:pimeloyl-ACP methyl ester carboxylesterase
LTRRLEVTASDGVPLAVYVDGEPHAPNTVLAVHGYPDNASMWQRVAELLAASHRVVRYDVRGSGQSGAPSGRRGYRLDQLADDARAVLDEVAPDHPVHLLGHDWGSVQGWYFLSSPQLTGRIASFTSISGPSLDHVRPWLLGQLRAGRPMPVLRQLAHSSYIPFFLLPVLPELAWRSGLLDRLLGSPRGSQRQSPDKQLPHKQLPVKQLPHRQLPDRQLSDKLHGLQLYRANLLGRPPRPRPIEIPVQVLAPSRDSFVGPQLQLEAPAEFVRRLSGLTVDAGHWLPATRPEMVAEAVTAFIARVEADPSG